MKRRITAFIYLLVLLSCSLTPSVSAAFLWEPWQEEMDAAVGFEWVLVDVLDYTVPSKYLDTSDSYSKGSFSFSYSAEDSSASSYMTFSAPPSSFKGGDIIKIDVENILTYQYREGDSSYNYSSYAEVLMGPHDLSPTDTSTTTRIFEAEDGVSSLGVGGLFNGNKKASATVAAAAAYGQEEGDRIGIHLVGHGTSLMQTSYIYEWKNTSGDRWVLVKAEENNIDEYVASMNVDHVVDGKKVVRTHKHTQKDGSILDEKTWIIDGEERYTAAEFTWSAPPNVIVVGKESEAKVFYGVNFLPGTSAGTDTAYAKLTMRADGPNDGYATDDTYQYFDFLGESSAASLFVDGTTSSATDIASPSGNVTKSGVMKEGAVMKIYVEGGLYGGGATYTYGFVPKGAAIGDIDIKDTETPVPGKADVVVNTSAGASAGESGVSVPALIAVGVLSSVAALGAAGTSSSKRTDKEEDNNGKTYKMYINKDFGDSIRYDKTGVPVYARMVEISKEGEESDRFDLTQKIEIFSSSPALKVRDSQLSGNYIGAFVEAESVMGTDNPIEGVVSFKFTGEGGTFQNNVKFKLIGEPYIKFDEQGDSLSMTLYMIEGDGEEYTVPFTLVDFMEPPEVELSQPDGCPFEAELEKLDDFHYKAKVRNTSVKTDRISFRSASYRVEVTASSEHDYKTDSFSADIYPEGLTVSLVKFDNEDNAQISAYEDKERVEGGECVLATRFKLELAVHTTNSSGRIKTELADLSRAEVSFDALRGRDMRTDNLASVFKYEIKPTSSAGIYQFQPKMQIPEGDSRHLMILPIACAYAGENYTLELPARLIGEPFNEMKEKKEELELLLKRIKRYMPPEDWSGVIAHIKENYERMSPKEIRLLNRSLYEITAHKLLNEAQENINYAEALDWVIWGLEWVKWVGDQAFSYVAYAYTGPVGEALLSPTKEIMVQLISENIWYREGISSPAQKLRGVNSNLMSMLENSLMTQISSDTSLKKAGVILACFTVIKIVNHYYNDIGPDGKPIGFYDAILAGLGDLTSNAFKFVVSSKFDELANSPKAKEYFQKYAGEWIKSLLDANAAGWREKGLEVVKKYVEESFGLMAAKVYSKATQVELEDKSGSLIIKINVWDSAANPNDSVIVAIDVMKVKDKLYDYIFGSLFGTFPFAPSPINPPDDPPFYVVK